MIFIGNYFQMIGVFNFKIYDNFTDFECKPYWVIFSVLITGVLCILNTGLQVIWLHMTDADSETISRKLLENFSSTDVVALVLFIIVMQFANVIFHLSNMSLCYELNSLTTAVRTLHIINGDQSLYPKCKFHYGYVFCILSVLFASQFLVGKATYDCHQCPIQLT